MKNCRYTEARSQRVLIEITIRKSHSLPLGRNQLKISVSCCYFYKYNRVVKHEETPEKNVILQMAEKRQLMLH